MAAPQISNCCNERVWGADEVSLDMGGNVTNALRAAGRKCAKYLPVKNENMGIHTVFYWRSTTIGPYGNELRSEHRSQTEQ